MLAGMWRAGYLEFCDLDKTPLTAWKVEQAFRTQSFLGMSTRRSKGCRGLTVMMPNHRLQLTGDARDGQ